MMKPKTKPKFLAENSARLLQNLWHSTGLEIENFDSAEVSKRLLDTLLVEAEIFEAGKLDLKAVAAEAFKFGLCVAANCSGDKYIFRRVIKAQAFSPSPVDANSICADCGYQMIEHPATTGLNGAAVHYFGCDGVVYALTEKQVSAGR